MTTQGLSRIAGGIAIVAVLVVSGMVAWSVLRHRDADLAAQQAETSRPDEVLRLGDLTGYLGQVDAAGRTIVVAGSPAGADPIVLAMANDVSVTVHGKQGDLGDLVKDMPVRVFYEVRNEVKHATSIQVVPDQPPAATPGPAEPGPPVEAKGAPETIGPRPVMEARPTPQPRPAVGPRPSIEPKPALEPRPTESRPAPPPPAPQAAKVPTESKPIETKPPTETRPPVESRPPTESRPPAEVRPVAPPVRPTPPPPAATAVTPRPATPPAAAAPAPPRAPAASPGGQDDDGSAAVDWLLKGAGRR